MVGQILHPFDGRECRDERGLYTLEHRHFAHRATVAPAAHREKRCALAVVADVRDESAVRSERRVDFSRDERIDFGGQLIVVRQALDVRRFGFVRISDHETLSGGVIERGARKKFDVLTGDDHFEVVVGAHLVVECSREELLEREVVAEVFASRRGNAEAQAELVSVRFGRQEFSEVLDGFGRDRDDRLSGVIGTGVAGKCFEWAHDEKATVRQVSTSKSDISAYLDSIRADADIMSSVIRTADAAASVAACPGWDVERVVGHTGTVHRWATSALLHATPPGPGIDFGPPTDANLAVWIVDGAAALIDTLRSTNPEADTWHPFPLEQQAWVWARRQALETAMHRWDAQTAVGLDSLLDPHLSSEGIHEYLEMGLPRVVSRADVELPISSLHVHCTDVDGEWLIWSDGGIYRMLPVHDKGDAAIRGAAADIWLLLMGRLDRDGVDSSINIVGDAAAADAWLDLPGW